MAQVFSLNGSNWLFKEYYGEDWRWRNAFRPGSRDFGRGWFPAQVPGSVLNDLVQSGRIPSPYFERNSLLSEWAPQRSWLYRTSFTAERGWQGRAARLVFEGVDDEAEFFLNGEPLGAHRGMFTRAVFEVGALLKYGEENLLVVAIAPAPHEQPQVGRTSRVHTFKARMNYWWDFCPRLVHQGIWRAVALHIDDAARLEDVQLRCECAEPFEQAALSLACRVASAVEQRAWLEVRVTLHGEAVAEKTSRVLLSAGSQVYPLTLEWNQPRLWWPNGHGAQVLYQAEVSLHLEGEAAAADLRRLPFGVRQIRFVENQGAPGDALPYTLQVNGRNIYINGWNWVPIDALYGVERPQKLERLLSLAAQAGANLLRVWGGGLIESEEFYNHCDRLGLLVWQEFIQSSSGIDNHPPTDPEFIAWVQEQARQVIPLRRNHPALALWCGGNELMDAAGRPLDDSHPMLAALHAAVTELDPGRAWLPTSASGPVAGNSLAEIEKDPTRLHDVHGPWEYQGLEAQYTLYNRGASLFHSEFGVEGITNRQALDAVLSPAEQFPVTLDNPTWFHLAAWWVKTPLWQETFGEFQSIEQAVQGTQFLQFEGLRYALEADRRRWPYNSGACPWQFNEPFPMAACTSAVDYFAVPKPGYEAVRTAYRALHVSARYPTLAWGGRDEFEAETWVHHNGAMPPWQGRLAWRVAGLRGEVFAAGEQAVAAGVNQSRRLGAVRCPLAEISGDLFFLDLACEDGGGSPAQNRYLFSRGANLAPIFRLPAAAVALGPAAQVSDGWQARLSNRGPNAALGLWFETLARGDSPSLPYFSENYFSLLPGESKTIHIRLGEVNSTLPRIALRGWNTAHMILTPGAQ